jgi:hypothetical protein
MAAAHPHPHNSTLWVHYPNVYESIVSSVTPTELEANPELGFAIAGQRVKGKLVKPSMVIGVLSHGQIAHRIDITDPTDDEEPSFVPWIKIGTFEDAVSTFNRGLPAKATSVVNFTATIKLHGTNAAVRVLRNGTVLTQSRNRLVTVNEDNKGFAAFIEPQHTQWSYLPPCVVYGEWVGQGVHHHPDAVCQLPETHFAIFAMRLTPKIGCHRVVTDPADLVGMLQPILSSRVHVLPSYATIDIDMRKPAQAAELLNQSIAKIAVCDPWVSSMFGLDGPGKGLVLTPTKTGFYQNPLLVVDRLTFKVKVPGHAKMKRSKPCNGAHEPIASAAEFVERYLTKARWQQWQAEGKGLVDAVTWLHRAIETESQEARVHLGISKDVAKDWLDWLDVAVAAIERCLG